jgi:hypothetical protein
MLLFGQQMLVLFLLAARDGRRLASSRELKLPRRFANVAIVIGEPTRRKPEPEPRGYLGYCRSVVVVMPAASLARRGGVVLVLVISSAVVAASRASWTSSCHFFFTSIMFGKQDEHVPKARRACTVHKLKFHMSRPSAFKWCLVKCCIVIFSWHLAWP